MTAETGNVVVLVPAAQSIGAARINAAGRYRQYNLIARNISRLPVLFESAAGSVLAKPRRQARPFALHTVWVGAAGHVDCHHALNGDWWMPSAIHACRDAFVAVRPDWAEVFRGAEFLWPSTLDGCA